MEIKRDEFEKWCFVGKEIVNLEYMEMFARSQRDQRVIKNMKKIIMTTLERENIEIDQKNVHTFTKSIMIHFKRENLIVYSLILIGMLIQRGNLIESVPNEDKKQELIRLVEMNLEAIPEEIVPDKEYLFSLILSNNKMKESELYDAVFKTIKLDDNNMLETDSRQKKDDNIYVFVSYSSKDVKTVKYIQSRLEAKGINCWRAPESIPTGADYTESIVEAIENCKAVLLVLSENSQQSNWVPKELDMAITNDKLIFPIKIDDSTIIKKIQFRLTDSQIIDANEDFEKTVEKVCLDISNGM